MTSFGHVVDKRIRALLEQENLEHVSDADIDYALNQTMQALDRDRDNEEIPYKVLDAREAAFSEADDAKQEGQKEEAVVALRKFWSV